MRTVEPETSELTEEVMVPSVNVSSSSVFICVHLWLIVSFPVM